MIDEELVLQAVGSPLYNSKKIPFCITTYSQRFAYVNEAFCKLIGYSRDELIGNSVDIIFENNKLITAFNEILYYLKHKQNKRETWNVKDKKGKLIVSKIENSTVKIGNKKYHLTITLDHTAEQENLGLAQANEEKYRHLTENLPHIIWTNDRTGKPVYMNKQALKYFGNSESDFSVWNWMHHIKEEDAMELKEDWKLASEQNNPIQKELRLKNFSGNYKWFQIILFPQIDEQKESRTWTAIATDVDDRIKAEQELKKTNNRLHSLINASPIPIYSLDSEGKVKDIWNPAAERILGWKKEEVLGNRTPLATPKYIKEFEKNLSIIKEKGQFKTVTKRQIKDGSEVTIEVNSGCIYNSANEIEEIIILLLDITQQEAQKIHLEESLAEKLTLLQEIHHRVKNNLAIVVSLLQLQVYQSSNNIEKNKLQDAQNRVMSIAMVHELLYSSDEFNKVDLKDYYEQLIKSITANMQVQTRGVQHELDITLENLNITQAIPLGLLINELLTNSLKYAFPPNSDDNCIKLSIHPEGNTIKVNYTDNGVGFDMEEGTFTSGLGFKIIESLLSQLDAYSEMDAENGFSLQFEFSNQLLDQHDSELV